MSHEPLIVTDIVTDATECVNGYKDPKDISLESLVLLVNTERLHHLENKITSEFIELKKRQDQVAYLHKLIKKINNATSKGEFDCSQDTELQQMLQQAKEYGVDLNDGKFKFNAEEREKLVENIKMTTDDLNVLNDMQLQTVTRLTTERYESYQLARSIMKPLHEDKTSKARAMAGR